MDWKAELQEKGVVVIPDILTEAQCAQYVDTIRGQLEKAVGKNMDSFLSQEAPDGVIHGLDNLRILWKIRTHPRVYEIFRELYDDDTCLCLYVDRFNYRPDGHEPLNQEWHLDENPIGAQSDYQAFLSLTPAEEEDDCLGILEKSHHDIREYMDNFPLYPFYREQYDWFLERGCTPRRVVCPAGSLVLWDSRCYHIPLNSLRPVPRARCVVYVRYFPADRTSYEQRSRIFETHPRYRDKELDLVSSDDAEYHAYLYSREPTRCIQS